MVADIYTVSHMGYLMIYLHDPHTEYTYEQLKEMCWEGNCDSDCEFCKTCCRNGCEECEE
jgi:hypothetical protein